MIGTLPAFPWDAIAEHRRRALEHADGIVNLALGEPVDPVPEIVQQALRSATDTPGYPPCEGTPALRKAAADWLARRHRVTVDPANVLAATGTKELIAWLPAMLGTGPGDVVALPELSFPTYEVSARLAGAATVVGPLSEESRPPRIVWLNSPSNPEGRVLSADRLREIVGWARERGSIVVNDECYLEYGWTAEPVSILAPEVCGGDHEGLLAVHSLSKRSNLAGYRAGIAAGDPRLVERLLAVRKQAGHIVPAPVQAAMIAALGDDSHVDQQRTRYRRRRDLLRSALESAGFRIDHSEASLFLWATRGQSCWVTLKELAELGILVAPGEFYGRAGARHVRVAFTAADERIGSAARRLSAG
ncbi:succinyldiaminopimelate transaminase [Amycolatopsis sp. WGS_07]|uniref:succinyldiaminopimelate transaminase n=1 Tax=Amycolatopsis sp. WGS_07 TaxID=3076764 RepID=UPI0038730E65